MKTIYLDNNILIYIFEKNNKIEYSALKNLYNNSNYRFVLSDISILEICQSPSLEKALHLGKEVKKLTPLWIKGFEQLQCEELKSYIFKNYFHVQYDNINPFFTSIIQLFYKENRIILLDLTIEKVIKFWFDNPMIKEINGKKEQYVDVLEQLQKHKKKGNITKKIEKITFNNYFVSRLPSKTPKGKYLTIHEKRDLLHFCLNHTSQVLKKCPCMSVENYMSEYRCSDPKRNPAKSDASDIMAACTAVAYCDYIVSNDGFLVHTCNYANTHSSANCKVVRKLTDIECDV